MKSKYKKCNSKELKSLSNISNAFCYDTQFDFHTNNYNNYRSIFSYKSIESNDEDENVKENNYYPITILLGFIMVIFFPIFGWFSLKLIRKKYKLAVFRYGRLLKISNPGIAFVIPLIDSYKYIDMRIKGTNIKSASCPTKDHGLIEIDCSIKYRITDPTFLIINVKNWTEFLVTETRIALLSAVKHFRWSDFSDERIGCDLENQIMKILSSNVEPKGLAICEVHVENMIQGKEPETPVDVLKKINFKDLGRQLSSITPLFMSSVLNESQNSDENDNESSKEKALKNFFEKLEIIKNIAISNLEQQKDTEKSSILKSSENVEAALLLEKLIKNFVRHNMSSNEISRTLQQQSLKPLFENVEKVAELLGNVKEIMKTYNINGNILFDVSFYFKYPCYFHYNHKEDALLNGKIDDNALIITLK